MTLTPAPALDRTYRVAQLVPGTVIRAGTVSEEFAGKGVNVSRNLALAGIHAPAVVPLSASEQSAHADNLLVFSLCQGRVRVNITTIEDDGRTTKVNQAATTLSVSEWIALRETTVETVARQGASWLLVAGTFPEGEGVEECGPQALRRALGPEVCIALDSSGPTLGRWAKSGVVDFIKPNVAELAETVGTPLASLGEVYDAARQVSSWGVATVAVSLGSAGFLAVSGEEVAWASASAPKVVNTIGAGDASVAGFFSRWLTPDRDLLEAVGAAAQWGAHKVQQSTSQLRDLEGLPQVRVLREIDRDLPVFTD